VLRLIYKLIFGTILLALFAAGGEVKLEEVFDKHEKLEESFVNDQKKIKTKKNLTSRSSKRSFYQLALKQDGSPSQSFYHLSNHHISFIYYSSYLDMSIS